MIRLAEARRSWAWPVLLAGSASLTLSMYALDTGGSFRIVVALWFFSVCPGMAWARALGIDDLAARWTFASAASVSGAILVALATAYVGASPSVPLLAIAVGMTIAGVGYGLRTRSVRPFRGGRDVQR